MEQKRFDKKNLIFIGALLASLLRPKLAPVPEKEARRDYPNAFLTEAADE